MSENTTQAITRSRRMEVKEEAASFRRVNDSCDGNEYCASGLVEF